MKRILIGIPTANDIHPQTFKSIYDQIIPAGYKADFQFFYGYNVDQVRNLIADWTVKGFGEFPGHQDNGRFRTSKTSLRESAAIITKTKGINYR